MESVFVAMSGGMDSSFAAYLLKQEGYKVVGITFQLLPAGMRSVKNPKACCSMETVMRAKKIADDLSIPHYVINLRKEFEEHVIENFLNEYKSGRTPNPCILCNKFIKFSSFPRRALSIGADKIATGHYAVIDERVKNYRIRKGNDATKDQSYFLYPIKKELLKYTLFPLGPFTKKNLRASLIKSGWKLAGTRESQDVCFIPEGDYRDFLSHYLQLRNGPIYHADGRLMGTHSGIHLYTVGQRKGLNIPYGEPLYVIDIIPEENRLVVGTRDHLERKSLVAYELNFFETNHGDLSSADLSAKIRYRQREESCTIAVSGDRLEVTFHNPVRAVTPGQSVVIYDNDTIVGGGIIESSA